MKRNKVRAIALMMGFGLIATMSSPANAATAQKINYYINGDCSDYYDEQGEYAFFESEPDWNCYISVYVKPYKPYRNIRLQFWSGTKWVQESSSTTNSSGKGYLDFDPYCSDGTYCDGEYKYRVIVDAASGQKASTSNNFYISYYPDTADYTDSTTW